MSWYAFPEHIRQRPAPNFCLPSSRGEPVSLAGYRGYSNLVLFFAHGVECAACRRALARFAGHRAGYRAQTAEVLVIAPGPADEGQTSSVSGLPVLTDPEGETRRAYAALLPEASPGEVLLFVLDRYGAPYAALACPEADGPALQQEALAWLAFIELQCPE